MGLWSRVSIRDGDPISQKHQNWKATIKELAPGKHPVQGVELGHDCCDYMIADMIVIAANFLYGCDKLGSFPLCVESRRVVSYN